MKNKSAFIICISAITAISAIAQTDVDRIVDEILSNNPELKAVRFNVSADKYAVAASNNLEDTEVEFSHQWGQGGIGNKWGIDVAQSFDWPGVYGIRSKANEATMNAMDYLTESKVYDTRYAIRAAITDLIYARKKIDLLHQMASHIDSMTAVYSRNAEKGEVSRLDVNKLKIERMAANRRLNETSIEYLNSVEAIQKLNGDKSLPEYLDRLDTFISAELRPCTFYENEGIRNNPSIKYAATMERAESLNEKALKRSRFPGLTIGYNHEYEMGDHFNGFKIGLTLPIFSNRHKTEEIKERRMALKAEQSNANSVMLSEIRTAYSQIQRLDNEIRQYQEILNDGENLRLLTIALDARHITLLEYLTEYNYFIDAQLSLIDITYQREILMTKLTRYSS